MLFFQKKKIKRAHIKKEFCLSHTKFFFNEFDDVGGSGAPHLTINMISFALLYTFIVTFLKKVRFEKPVLTKYIFRKLQLQQENTVTEVLHSFDLLFKQIFFLGDLYAASLRHCFLPKALIIK